MQKWKGKTTTKTPIEDKLGRKDIAKVLGKKIISLPQQTGAYNIGVYGEFGSGKTIFLEYLDQYLSENG
jgi:predicted KAP-like P-loop ATPase